jgi:hypothetical protein
MRTRKYKQNRQLFPDLSTVRTGTVTTLIILSVMVAMSARDTATRLHIMLHQYSIILPLFP